MKKAQQRTVLLTAFCCIVALIGFLYLQFVASSKQRQNPIDSKADIVSGSFDTSLFRTEEEWKQLLSSPQYHILREAGTEIAFTGALLGEKRAGTYYSAGCNQPVFRSEQKYDSGTGWPSFWAPIDEHALVLRREQKIPGYERIEVLDRCGGHLGHVFDDGPEPTGKRFCINSDALIFIPDSQNERSVVD